MHAVTDPEEFRAAPLGRFYAGPSWLVWCWDQTLCGSLVWGRPSEEEARGLVRMFAIESSLAPRFDVLTDGSRMNLVTPATFAVVADYLRNQLSGFDRRIRKNAIVTPPGLIGAAIAGLYPMLGAKLNWKPVHDLRTALDWIDSDAARAAGPGLHKLLEKWTGRSALLHRLHEFLRAHLLEASIDQAALALAMSRRSLQRSLAKAKTRFRDELETVRIEEASRRLAEGDDKLETLASEAGFSSASHLGSTYLAATGETPGQFRARHRKGS